MTEGNGEAARALINFTTATPRVVLHFPSMLLSHSRFCVFRLGMLASCLGLGACSLARPEARAINVQLTRTDGALAEVAVVMELRNTGKDEIELVEFDYILTLSDGARYGGRWAALRALPPNHTVTATVPAVVPLSSLRNGASGWTVTGSLGYRDPSSFARILYEAGILHYEVPISSAGTTILPLDGSPQQPPKGG